MNLTTSIHHPRSSWVKVVRLATCALALFFLSAQLAERPARADDDTVTKLEKLSQKAMENYDNFDFETAKKLLNAAVAKAKTEGLENEPIVAKIYLDLGIIFFSGDKDKESARVAFIDAVKVDPDIEIDAVYKTDEMQALLDEVKAQFGNSGGNKRPSGGADCASVEGLAHDLIDTTASGADREFVALVGRDLDADKVALFYRFHGVEDASPDFKRLDMTTSDQCEYKATIPGPAIVSGVIHYYIAAFDSDGKELTSKGSERTPNLIEIEVGGEGSDRDNPFGGSSHTRDKGPKGPSKIFVSVALGSGGALVTGETEQMFAPVNTGFAPALFHVFPEVGYYLTPKTSVSAALRLGFPLRANIDNHATAAVAGVVRLRQSLSDTGEGLFWSAAVGGGMIRQTITLTDAQQGMDVDITTIGPLFLGGGAGFASPMGSSVKFVGELSALVGVPVISELAAAPKLNFGVQFDLNVGMVLSF